MKTTIHPGIMGVKVFLRSICSNDIELLRSFVNNPQVMRFSNVYRPINDYQQEMWYQNINEATDCVWFAIDDVREGEPRLVGTCCLIDIDWIGRLAEFRIRIGDQNAWGQGLGTEASQQLIRYGFLDLNLERIWLRVFASNPRAIHLYQKLGFQTEGRLRKAAYIEGSIEDIILMGILREEWRQYSGIPQVQRVPRGE